MPDYVPYFTVVKQPGKQFLREFGSSAGMGIRDMDSGEFGREAQTNWPLYLECVQRSLSHSFYHNAPSGPHWVISPEGERKYLRDMKEVGQFYTGLSDAEKQKIVDEKGNLADLVRFEQGVSQNT